MVRKAVVVAALVGMLAVSASAQYYADIGFGVGWGSTSIDGNNVTDDMPNSVSEIGVDVGLRLGYGPLGGMPLFGTVEIAGIGHRLSEGGDYIQFNSYLIGPGLMFYPVDRVQLSAAIGYSFTAHDDSFGSRYYDASGFAYSLQGGYELGSGAHRALIGLKWMGTHTTTENTKVDMNQYGLTVFIRYVFKQI